VVDAASHPALKKAIIENKEDTESQMERLEAILETHGA
jgi:ferritin-like metal-binding protein YciE